MLEDVEAREDDEVALPHQLAAPGDVGGDPLELGIGRALQEGVQRAQLQVPVHLLPVHFLEAEDVGVDPRQLGTHQPDALGERGLLPRFVVEVLQIERGDADWLFHGAARSAGGSRRFLRDLFRLKMETRHRANNLAVRRRPLLQRPLDAGRCRVDGCSTPCTGSAHSRGARAMRRPSASLWSAAWRTCTVWLALTAVTGTGAPWRMAAASCR